MVQRRVDVHATKAGVGSACALDLGSVDRHRAQNLIWGRVTVPAQTSSEPWILLTVVDRIRGNRVVGSRGPCPSMMIIVDFIVSNTF